MAPYHPLLVEQLGAAGVAAPSADEGLVQLLNQISATYQRLECARRRDLISRPHPSTTTGRSPWTHHDSAVVTSCRSFLLTDEVGVASRLLPMLRTDVAGSVVEWNSQLAELTGVVASEIVGQPLVSLVEQDARPRVVRMLSRALQGHVIIPREVEPA